MRKRIVAVLVALLVLLSVLAYYAQVQTAPVTSSGTTNTTIASSNTSSSTSITTSATTSLTTSLATSSSITTTASTSSLSSTSQTATTSGLGGNWTTYHRDNARSGSDPSVNFTSVRKDWSSPKLDGEIYAEPLLLGNSLFVTTENDTVYSLDARNGSIAWSVHLGDPVPGTALPCGDISPSGITGTGVIDPSTLTLYVVAFLSPPAHHVLFAMNTRNGKIDFQVPADAPGSDPTVQQQRAALTLSGGTVYVPYGGLYGDCGQYHGWVVGIGENGTGTTTTSYRVPTGREGGIWSPSGAATDASGNLYVTTGNGASTSTFDHGDSVIKLSSGLQELGFFAPSNWAQLNGADRDLGTEGPIALDGGRLFQIGKEGVGYLLNTSSLGGIGGQIFSQKVCDGAYGASAYLQPYAFVPCVNGLFVLRVDGTSFTTVWQAQNLNPGPPIITGGVVWALDVSSGTIHAFRVSDGKEIFSSPVGEVTRFSTPTSGGGRIFVGTRDGVVVAFVLS